MLRVFSNRWPCMFKLSSGPGFRRLYRRWAKGNAIRCNRKTIWVEVVDIMVSSIAEIKKFGEKKWPFRPWFQLWRGSTPSYGECRASNRASKAYRSRLGLNNRTNTGARSASRVSFPFRDRDGPERLWRWVWLRFEGREAWLEVLLMTFVSKRNLGRVGNETPSTQPFAMGNAECRLSHSSNALRITS